MVDNVLVAMDGSEMSEKALRYALETFQGAEVTVLTVVGEPSSLFGEATAIALAEDMGESATEHAEPVLDRARDIAAEYDTDIGTEVKVGHPARAIINRAEAFDTVVIGSHGGTLADRLFVGNIAEKVSRRSPVPVTIVR